MLRVIMSGTPSQLRTLRRLRLYERQQGPVGALVREASEVAAELDAAVAVAAAGAPGASPSVGAVVAAAAGTPGAAPGAALIPTPPTTPPGRPSRSRDEARWGGKEAKSPAVAAPLVPRRAH